MKKLIYSNKYPDLEELDIPANELLLALSEAENKIYKDLVYIPIPGREDIKDIFIQRAKYSSLPPRRNIYNTPASEICRRVFPFVLRS